MIITTAPAKKTTEKISALTMEMGLPVALELIYCSFPCSPKPSSRQCICPTSSHSSSSYSSCCCTHRRSRSLVPFFTTMEPWYPHISQAQCPPLSGRTAPPPGCFRLPTASSRRAATASLQPSLIRYVEWNRRGCHCHCHFYDT